MPDNRRELIKYRLESARERLNSAEVLLASKSYKDSIGRSYYAMFTAVRALLAKDGVDYSKHAGVISYFQREYIKTQKFEKKYSKYLSQAFQPSVSLQLSSYGNSFLRQRERPSRI